MAGLSEAEQEKRITAAAESLNLTDYLDRKPGQLSGGQRQRVGMRIEIVVLQAGVIEQVGSTIELYERPKNLFVAGFIGSHKMNFIEGEEAFGRIDILINNAAIFSAAPSWRLSAPISHAPSGAGLPDDADRARSRNEGL